MAPVFPEASSGPGSCPAQLGPFYYVDPPRGSRLCVSVWSACFLFPPIVASFFLFLLSVLQRQSAERQSTGGLPPPMLDYMLCSRADLASWIAPPRGRGRRQTGLGASWVGPPIPQILLCTM